MEWNEELMSIVQPEPVQTGLSAAVQERARVFGKWLWIYFWVMIASIVPGLIGGFEVGMETGTIVGTAIGWGFSAVLVYAMFQLGRVQDRLKTCAGLNVVTLVAQIIVHFVNSEFLTNLWSIPSVIIGLIVSYQFIHGCGDALVGVDNEQAEKWYKLWKWLVGLLVGGLLGLIPAMLLVVMLENILVAIICIVAMIVWMVMLIVQVVKEYVYIYRTAKIFRGIAENL